MKTKPKPDDVRGDSATFVDFMRKLIAVPHDEIKAQAEAEGKWERRFYGASRAAGAASKQSR
jgi:hypothetical protein